jgi:hypothetical protein
MLRISGLPYLGATETDSLRVFFRARFLAKACFTQRFAPGCFNDVFCLNLTLEATEGVLY